MEPLFVKKTGNELVVNSATYQDDSELQITLTETGVYEYRLHLPCYANADAGIKVRFYGPVFTASKSTVGYNAGAVAAHEMNAGKTCMYALVALDDVQSSGLITVTDITNPVLKIQWAQNVAHTDATIINEDAYLILWKVG